MVLSSLPFYLPYKGKMSGHKHQTSEPPFCCVWNIFPQLPVAVPLRASEFLAPELSIQPLALILQNPLTPLCSLSSLQSRKGSMCPFLNIAFIFPLHQCLKDKSLCFIHLWACYNMIKRLCSIDSLLTSCCGFPHFVLKFAWCIMSL